MRFFETTSGKLIPISRIFAIYPKRLPEGAKPTHRTYSIVLDDAEGWPEDVDKETVEAIRRASAGSMIPALPGTYLLTCYGEPDAGAIREPIIAWRPDNYGGIEPVTLDWEQTGIKAVNAVLFPDGIVQDMWTTVFASEADWVAHRKLEVLTQATAEERKAAE